MSDIIAVSILLVALALFAIGSAAACFVFSKALFHVVQTLGFTRALIEQAKTTYALDSAKEHLERQRPTVEPHMFDDDTLREAARREPNGASTGDSFIPGYDEPPPAAGDARLGAAIDGEMDDEPIPEGGYHAR